jgi:hypothetical protein
MTAVTDTGKWCGMCKCWHGIITCELCSAEMHYG